jgi:hypothetical protein
VSDPFQPPSDVPSGEQELEVDLGAFLPSDVVVGEPSPTDVDAGPVDAPVADAEPSAAHGQGPDLAALEQIATDLTAVDAALAALDAGTYGRCAACDAPIADELLAADPTRATCAAHA